MRLLRKGVRWTVCYVAQHLRFKCPAWNGTVYVWLLVWTFSALVFGHCGRSVSGSAATNAQLSSFDPIAPLDYKTIQREKSCTYEC